MRKEAKPWSWETLPKKLVPWFFWYKCVKCRKLIKHEPVWRYRCWTCCCKCASTPKMAVKIVEHFIEHDLVIVDIS